VGGAAFVLVMIFLRFSSIASAHHSRASYLTDDKAITMQGTVTEYNWRNPHVFIVWDTKDSNGKVVRWAGELSSPTTMISQGMSRNSVKVGDEITVTAVPSVSGDPLSLIRKVVRSDGSVVIDLTKPTGRPD
jgi:hypothetical protein